MCNTDFDLHMLAVMWLPGIAFDVNVLAYIWLYDIALDLQF